MLWEIWIDGKHLGTVIEQARHTYVSLLVENGILPRMPLPTSVEFILVQAKAHKT